MNELKIQFGKRIKELREKNKYSQEQLAEKINMEARHISRIETGNSFTTIENIDKLAKALNVTMSELFNFQHKQNRTIIEKDLINFIKIAETSELEQIYKIIHCIMV